MSDTNQSGNSRSVTAERTRLYRQRRRQGLRCISIPLQLHVTEVHDLIRSGILKEEQREDSEALRAAVLRLIRQALDDMRW